MFAHLQRVPLGFHIGARAGDLTSRFTSDADAVERTVKEDLPYALSFALTTVVGIALLFVVEARLAAICAILLPLVAVGPRLLGSRPDRAGDARQRAAGDVASAIAENLAGQRVIRAFGLGSSEMRRLDERQEQLARRGARVGLFNGAFEASVNAAGYLVLIVGISAGSWLVYRRELTVGGMVAFVDLLWFVTSAVQQLSSVIGPFQLAAAGMRRLSELVSEPLDPQPRGARAGDLEPGAIRIDGVTFAHEPGRPVLLDIDIEIPVGGRVAIVGPSASGKSTLLTLLLRFAVAQSGRITIGGVDLADVPEAALRDHIGVVFQENYIFNTSIADNIRLARPAATAAAVAAAASAAELDGAALATADGLGSLAGEDGSRLSGGQRQRIAIARLLLRDAPVMVFDEPTSALDVATEAAINGTLERVTSGRTSITVTHRLTGIVNADLIVVLADGRVVESGRHDELIELRGRYYDLWRKQGGFHLRDGATAVDPERLTGVPIFADLDPAALATLAELFVPEEVPAGRLVIHEGDIGDRLYIMVRGRAEVLLREPSGALRRVGLLEDGDHFGEVALLRAVPRTASVRTLDTCTFLTLHGAHFQRLLASFPGLAETFEQAHERRISGRIERQ